jgi:hypothetical protein
VCKRVAAGEDYVSVVDQLVVVYVDGWMLGMRL